MDKKKKASSVKYHFAIRRSLLVLAVLVIIGLAVFVIESHDYIGIYMAAKSTSSETLEQNSEQAKTNLQDKLDTLVTPGSPVAGSDPVGTENTGPADDPAGTSQSSADGKAAASQDYSEDIQAHYTALESLKDSYLSQFETIVQSTKSDYAALPKDKQTYEKMISIVMSKKGELEDLESTCDSQVKSEVDAIRDLLKLSGQDTSLADEIQDAYDNMKAALKTEYVNKLYS